MKQAETRLPVEIPSPPAITAQWREFYEPIVAEQLRPDQLYSIIQVGGCQYAYTSYEAHARALREIWAAGLVPTSGPTGIRGTDLPDVAPQLRGVDTDLSELLRSHVEVPRRRFST